MGRSNILRSWDRVALQVLLGVLVATAAIMLGAPSSANPAMAVTARAPSAVSAQPEPTCESPYAAVGYVLGAVGVPDLPPGVTGEVRPYAQAGATVSVEPDGTALVLTVTLDGTTRQFTTGSHELGGDYNRTPGPSDTGYGVVNIVSDTDGAVYVVLVQNNSGAYTRIAWRFDDPCVSAAEAVTTNPDFTG